MQPYIDTTTGERSTTEQISTRILQLLLPHRRHVPGEQPPIPVAFTRQLNQIAQFVRVGEPLLFTLPGFPCKSPNPDKVLGTLPDEGERLSLAFLDDLCVAIKKVYSPGARMLICSDGHIFGDLIGVPDNDIDAYAKGIREIIRAESRTRIATFSLANMLGSLSYDEKREQIVNSFAPSPQELHDWVHSDDNAARLYRGITRFLVEDTVGFTGSRSALQRRCRERAYGVIQRSTAWGALIAQQFPRSVRLSIHPQPADAEKFGIRLLGISDMWTTPWHSCVVLHPDGTPELVPHWQVRGTYTLVYHHGRPSHYKITRSLSTAGAA